VILAIRVAIADDHPVLLAGMKYLLAGLSGMSVVGLVTDSTKLVDLLVRREVDVVVTDFSMPGGKYGDGIALLRFLVRRFPRLRLIVLTGVESNQVLRNILNVAVNVIVSKADHLDCLEVAIRRAYDRKPYLSPEAQRLLKKGEFNGVGTAEAPLSKREMEVLRMYAEGLSIVDIGRLTGRSRKTISSQKMSVMRKLGLLTEADIYQYAMATGLIVSSQMSRYRS
jgi:two-component system, NarL family, captular synthesis response regulator RcsB